MSLHEYKVSQHISTQDYPFYALIMAAFRKADSDNLGKLRYAFPVTWLELKERYDAPGGLLEEEQFIHPLEKYFGPADGYWEDDEEPDVPETIMGMRVKVTDAAPERMTIVLGSFNDYDYRKEPDGTDDTGD